MRMLITLNILLVIILISTCSLAASWQEYFHAADGSRSYIDNSSIVKLPDGKVRAWAKLQSSNGKGNLSLTEVDCKQRMYTIRAMEPLNPNDIKSLKGFETVMKSWTEPSQHWNYIDTTDSQEAMYNCWCSNNFKK